MNLNHNRDDKRIRRGAIPVAIACLVLLAGCDRDGQRLTSETVPLDDGRTVVCVREVGINTRLDCDWSTDRPHPDGEEIPGVELVEGGSYLQVRPTAEARASVTAMLARELES